MRTERWWSVILTMGLFIVLSPLSAQAGPNRTFAPQPNRQALAQPQPRAHPHGWNSQPHQWQQPRGLAHGWNGQNRQWHQPGGNAYGWNRQPHHGQHHPGNAYGWNAQNRQWQHPRGNPYGWNGHQRQWDQHRNAYGRNDHQWQQPPNGGQHNNHSSSFNRAGHPTHPQSPNIAPNSPGYSHNTPLPAGQTGAHPGFRHPEASGNTPQPHAQSPSGVI